MSYSARPTSTDLLTKLINKVGHGFVPGQIIIYNGATYVNAIATNILNSQGAMMVSIVVDADSFYATQTGYVNDLTRDANYTTGVQYYLSDTSAGHLTTVAPSAAGRVLLPCFVADSSTSGYFYGGTGIVIPSGFLTAWSVINANQTMAVNNGYFTNAVGAVTVAVPVTFDVGDQFFVAAHSAGGFIVDAPPGVTIYDLGVGTATSPGGTVSSTVQGNTLHMVAVVADTDLRIINSKGTLAYA